LVARNTLGRSNAALEQSLTRLSTGLRINTGKDDPAGLIASENLRSDITSIRKAISNTDRANQVIATADSALGQVSSLLNDIRGLVTESANSGALSDEQIEANQAQVDSSLDALNRISQTTTFQGRRLLDGSLDFITSAGSNFANVSDLQIDQANLGASGAVSVSVNVTSAATQAQVDVTSIPAAVAGVAATGNIALSNTVTQSVHDITFGTAADVTLTAEAAGNAGGAAGNTFSGVTIVDSAVAGSTYNATTGVLTVNVDIAGGDNTVADLVTAINAGTEFNATANAGGAESIAAGALTLTDNTLTTTGQSAGSATLAVTAEQTGTAANGVTATIIEDGAIAAGTASASLNGGNVEVRVNGTVAYSAIQSAIDDLTGYTASLSGATGNQYYISSADTPPTAATLAGGVDSAGGIANDVVLELTGSTGSQVLTFGAGTSIAELAAGVNLVSDATGVQATVNGTTLQLQSTIYGSESVVDLRVITEGSGSTASGTFTTAVGQGTRTTGADIVASINGVSATGKGNRLSINTATLDLSASVTAGFTGSAQFNITGGGALFQLGPEVVSNQQARLGIGSVNTAKLGGVSGKLYQLANGKLASLTSDANLAASIVGEAIDQVTSLRGRLGAFQRTTLETNKNALNDTLVNLTDAESTIRDADFAVESANLTRAQILVQSGTTVLQISNQNPQNVLALLR
jgi:flagellin